MKEDEYITAVNRTRFRAIKEALNDVLPGIEYGVNEHHLRHIKAQVELMHDAILSHCRIDTD